VSTIAERVAAGAALLDEHIPDWWRDHNIDLSRFEMSEEKCCVVGQLSPQRDYQRAVDEHWLDLTTDAARALGFLAQQSWPDTDDDDVMAEYDELQHAWVVVITERRAAA
jgi:hypothetical protein